MGLETDRDVLREAARRIDWRFLLPDPELGRVGYGGRSDSGLFEACSLLCDVTLLDGLNGPFDTVVLAGPPRGGLEAAAAAVRPGGWLYVEVDNSPRARLGGHGSLAGHLRTARRLGLEEIQAHWHWPGFARCEELIPLDESGAVRNALARRHSRAPAKTGLGRLLLRLGLIGVVASSTSVVARRPKR